VHSYLIPEAKILNLTLTKEIIIFSQLMDNLTHNNKCNSIKINRISNSISHTNFNKIKISLRISIKTKLLINSIDKAQIFKNKIVKQKVINSLRESNQSLAINQPPLEPMGLSENSLPD
jgi:hypothetical protein